MSSGDRTLSYAYLQSCCGLEQWVSRFFLFVELEEDDTLVLTLYLIPP